MSVMRENERNRPLELTTWYHACLRAIENRDRSEEGREPLGKARARQVIDFLGRRISTPDILGPIMEKELRLDELAEEITKQQDNARNN